MPATTARLALAYVSARKARGEFTQGTADNSYGLLRSFAEHVGPDRPPSALTRSQLESWLGSKKVSPATKRVLLSHARSWSHWLLLEGHTKHDFTLGVVGPKQPRPSPRGMSDRDIGLLLAACPDPRGRLIVQLMRQEGCRCVEVSRLQTGDVDLHDMTVHLVGKGLHERTLPLTEACAEAVEEYVRAVPVRSGPLVRSYNMPSQPLDPTTISRFVSVWAEAAGVHLAGDTRTAHSLRHRFAQAMVANGANLRTVQAALGHSSLATTTRYVGLASLSDMRAAMEGPHGEAGREERVG